MALVSNSGYGDADSFTSHVGIRGRWTDRYGNQIQQWKEENHQNEL